MAVCDYTGGSLRGQRDPNVDEYARKEALRNNRRRPIEETLAEVGEGRCKRGSLHRSASKQLTVQPNSNSPSRI